MSNPPDWTFNIRPRGVPYGLRMWDQSDDNDNFDDQCVPGRRSPVKGRTSSFRVSRTSVFESHTSNLRQGRLSICVRTNSWVELRDLCMLLSFPLQCIDSSEVTAVTLLHWGEWKSKDLIWFRFKGLWHTYIFPSSLAQWDLRQPVLAFLLLRLEPIMEVKLEVVHVIKATSVTLCLRWMTFWRSATPFSSSAGSMATTL